MTDSLLNCLDHAPYMQEVFGNLLNQRFWKVLPVYFEFQYYAICSACENESH